MSKLSEPEPRLLPSPAAIPAPGPARWWLPPAILAAGFLLLLWQVASRGPVVQLDVHVRNVIQGLATSSSLSSLVPVGHGLADLGDPPLCVPILLFSAILAGAVGRTWRPALAFLGAVATLILVAYLKVSVNRPGPGQYTAGRTNPFNAGPGNASYGPGLADAGQGWGYFPSGHTADALICFGAAALMLNAWVFADPRVRAWAGRLVAVLVGLVIVGLLWSNYHWLSDIVGSLCLCGAALLLFRRFCVRKPVGDGDADGGGEDSGTW
jgi:membrane-associated phospholipid phosphatase